MMKLKSFFNIEISGLNQEKIFNKFTEMGIEILDLIRTSRLTATFSIKPNNLKTVRKYLEQNQIKIIKIEKLGLIKFCSALILRIGVLIGFCLSILLLFIADNFIFYIRIYGNENLKSDKIINCLYQNNVHSFSLKNAIKNEKLETLLLENFNEISMVSVIKKGTHLIINIKEKITENATEYENIVSENNGRIIEINLISGTLKKQVGDIFKIGDILVEGSFVNTSGEKQKIKPQAEIKAEIWYEEKIIHYEKRIVTEYTGNEIKLRSILLFGLELFSSFSSKTFEKFELQENYVQPKNVILPIVIKYSVFKEIKVYEKISLFEEVKDELINECKQKTLQKINNNDIIKSEKCTITPGAGFTVVSYLMIIEKELASN